MLEVAGIVLTLLVIVYMIAMKFRIDNVNRKVDGFYAPYNDMFSKVNRLYKRDKYGTSRPKVDMLEDTTDKFEQSVWIEMSKLQDRIKESEKKNK